MGLFYPSYYFTFGIVFYVGAGYKVGKYVLQIVAKHSFSLVLIER